MTREKGQKKSALLRYKAFRVRIRYKEMLQTCIPKLYKVKFGQTIKEIEYAFSTTPALLIYENQLTQEVYDGQILKIPCLGGNLYTAQAGEGKTLLCGSEENFERKNGTNILYPGMKVVL